MKQIAEQYLNASLNPLPLRENKAPNLRSGHPYLYEANDDLEGFDSPNTVRIGVACGEVSDNFCALDFDRHQGQELQAIFYEFIDTDAVASLIAQRKLSIYSTPSGGYHIYMRTEDVPKPAVFSRYDDGSVMIEMRGHGQYVATYPSAGYMHLKGCELIDTPHIEQYEAEYLFQRATMFNAFVDDAVKVTGNSLSDKSRAWPDTWPNDTPDGIYNNTGADAAKQCLIRAGWSQSSRPTRNGVEYWIRPGKDERDGISASFGVRRNMFYVFTSNAAPFQANSAYTPFAVLTLLEYSGDFKRAKDDLRKDYSLPEVRDPEPLPPVYQNIDPGKFPLDILPPDYVRFIREVASTLNFSEDYLACGMLCVFSFLIGNRIKLRVKNGYHANAIIWMAIVASRGAIKSHPLNYILKTIKEIDHERYLVFQEQLEQYMAKPKDERDKTPTPEYHPFKVANATVEGLQKNLTNNPNGILLHYDELSGFFNSLNSYKGGKGSDTEFMLSGFNNDDFSVVRKMTGNTYLRNIYFTVAGTIQYEVLSTIAGQFSDNGMLDRFLYTRSESTAYGITDKDLDPDIESFWTETIKQYYNELNRHIDEPMLAEFTPKGFKTFQELDHRIAQEQNDPDTDPRMVAYMSKIRTYIPRFCCILAAIDMLEYGSPLEVSSDHVKRAEMMAQYFTSTAASVFTENSKHKDINQILSGNRSASKKEKVELLLKTGEFTKSEIAKAVQVSNPYVTKVAQAMDQKKSK
jgi:hypothetical protein